MVQAYVGMSFIELMDSLAVDLLDCEVFCILAVTYEENTGDEEAHCSVLLTLGFGVAIELGIQGHDHERPTLKMRGRSFTRPTAGRCICSIGAASAPLNLEEEPRGERYSLEDARERIRAVCNRHTVNGRTARTFVNLITELRMDEYELEDGWGRRYWVYVCRHQKNRLLAILIHTQFVLRQSITCEWHRHRVNGYRSAHATHLPLPVRPERQTNTRFHKTRELQK